MEKEITQEEKELKEKIEKEMLNKIINATGRISIEFMKKSNKKREDCQEAIKICEDILE